MVGIDVRRREFLKTSGAATAGLTMVDSLMAMDSKEKIKVGQIGVGHAHATKLSVYRNSPDYEVVGIVEPSAKLRSQAGKQAAFRDLPWMTEEQLLSTPGLQVVLVETEVRDLLDTAERCIAAGKHIHLDKPAGESLPQFRRIMNSAESQKLMVQMGYMYRYNPAILLLREFLTNGWLGDIFEVHTVMSKVVPADNRSGLAEYPGGMMFELGCHILDLTIGVLGKPDSVTSYRQHSAPIQDDLLDNMLAVLTYPQAIATVKSSAQEVEGFARRHFVVCGTKGTFHIQPLDRPAAQIALAEPQGNYKRGYQEITFPRYSRYAADAADMVRVLRGEKPNDFPYKHDLIVQETLLKACGLPIN